MANQDGWQFCRKCQGLFRASVHRGTTEYALGQLGQCPASKRYGCPLLHDSMQAPPYVLRIKGPNDKDGPKGGVQLGWKCCQKCQGLFFANNADPGACPIGGKHDGSQSDAYAVRMGGQEPSRADWWDRGWRWCRKCQGMFCATYDPGVCPADNNKHDATQSGAYFMRLHDKSPRDHFTFDCSSIVLNGVAVGGSSHLTLAVDGSCTLSWHFHDSGALEYNVHLAWIVKDCWNVVYTHPGFTHDGSVHGTFEAGLRDDSGGAPEFHNWDVRDNWPDLAAGASAEANVSVDMDAVNIVNNVLSTGLGIAGVVLAVVGLAAAAPLVGGVGAAAGAAAGVMKAVKK